LLLTWCFGTGSSIATSLTSRVATIFFNDAVNLALCADARTRIARDAALTLGAGFRAVDELDPSA